MQIDYAALKHCTAHALGIRCEALTPGRGGSCSVDILGLVRWKKSFAFTLEVLLESKKSLGGN